MTNPSDRAAIAIIGDDTSTLPPELARQLGPDALAAARHVAPQDVADLDRPVREGAFQTVVFEHLGDFAAALWDERLAANDWLAAGVTIHIADTPHPQPGVFARQLIAAWTRWTARRRRQRVVAGVILSTIAIAAASLILWFAR